MRKDPDYRRTAGGLPRVGISVEAAGDELFLQKRTTRCLLLRVVEVEGTMLIIIVRIPRMPVTLLPELHEKSESAMAEPDERMEMAGLPYEIIVEIPEPDG